MTQDIGLSLLTGFGNENRFIKELIANFSSRISDPEEFALTNRVLLLKASNDVSVDITLSGLPFEKKMIENATYFQYSPHCSLLTCSAEDLIVLKAFADRNKDWMDVEGIMIRQENKLNFNYIFEQLGPLSEIKEDPEILNKLNSLKKTLSI